LMCVSCLSEATAAEAMRQPQKNKVIGLKFTKIPWQKRRLHH
jgi:hypothetical protein